MHLSDLQRELKDLMQGIEHPRMGVALALAEETGEVMRCVLDRECYGKDTLRELEGEVGDVLVALAELCERYGLSLERAGEGAVAKIRSKAPGWRAELGDRMARLRERMDGAPPAAG